MYLLMSFMTQRSVGPNTLDALIVRIPQLSSGSFPRHNKKMPWLSSLFALHVVSGGLRASNKEANGR